MCLHKTPPSILLLSKLYLAAISLMALLTVVIGVFTSEMFEQRSEAAKSGHKWEEWKITYKRHYLDNHFHEVVNQSRLFNSIDKEFKFWQDSYLDHVRVFQILYVAVGLLGSSFLFILISIAIQASSTETYNLEESWLRRTDYVVTSIGCILAVLGTVFLSYADHTCGAYRLIIHESRAFHKDIIDSVPNTYDMPLFTRSEYPGFPHFPRENTGLFRGKLGTGILVIGEQITDSLQLEIYCRQSFNIPVLTIAKFIGGLAVNIFVAIIILMTLCLDTSLDDDDDPYHDFRDLGAVASLSSYAVMPTPTPSTPAPPRARRSRVQRVLKDDATETLFTHSQAVETYNSPTESVATVILS